MGAGYYVNSVALILYLYLNLKYLCSTLFGGDYWCIWCLIVLLVVWFGLVVSLWFLDSVLVVICLRFVLMFAWTVCAG